MLLGWKEDPGMDLRYGLWSDFSQSWVVKLIFDLPGPDILGPFPRGFRRHDPVEKAMASRREAHPRGLQYCKVVCFQQFFPLLCYQSSP